MQLYVMNEMLHLFHAGYLLLVHYCFSSDVAKHCR